MNVNIEGYGNYSSENYGINALKVNFGDLTIWFSYKTPIAYRYAGSGITVVRENDWKQTTGKHLNAIDGGNKKGRIKGELFEAQLNEILVKCNLSI